LVSHNFSHHEEFFVASHQKEQNGLETISWSEGRVRLLDQSRLPLEEVYLEIDDCRGMAKAIREMRIRGAPALGLAAAYGLALAAHSSPTADKQALMGDLEAAARMLESTRPTAVNLAWALRRVLGVAQGASSPETIRDAALREAQRIHQENREADERMGRLGAELIADGATVLTHCNTGALATGGYGTALGVIRAAHDQGKALRVLVDETRPLLQGTRLTAWELQRLGIPATLIVDAAAGGFMRRGTVSCVLVGADRIAANGDVANKIGTYPLAVLAKENGVPFYVASPTSTIDLSLAGGDDITIEERSPDEVTTLAGKQLAPEGIAVANPAFDVTPHGYISAIVTERGIVRAPYRQGLDHLFQAAIGSQTRKAG
jgi:methylthioribose-1-phosphate isomerase